METDPEQDDTTAETKPRLPKIVWLAFAFAPSILAIAGFQTSLFLFSLTILNVFFSFLSASKMLGTSQEGGRFLTFGSLGLGLGIFLLNAVISVFVGCTLL